jgi:hypothetical protein
VQEAGGHGGTTLLFETQNIAKISSLKELEKDLKPGTLVVTELDHVLWETQGSIGSRAFLKYMQEKNLAMGDCPQTAREKAERLFEKVQRRAQVRLLEEDAASFFLKLKEKKCGLVAVTFRPKVLWQRTCEQAESLGLRFPSPFKEEIICSNEGESQFQILEEKLPQLSPTQILAVSNNLGDLIQLQLVAKRHKIPFQGRLLSGRGRTVYLDDELFALELRCLDNLLSNEEAALLLP